MITDYGSGDFGSNYVNRRAMAPLGAARPRAWHQLNDQFGGANSWDEYLDPLKQATPALRAIGVTDYYSLDCYERLTAAKNDGRLQDCALLFPNIEMRLGVGSAKFARPKRSTNALPISPAGPP